MEKMNIIYPPLVEQMYKFMHQVDRKVTKQDVYKKAFELNLIDYQGHPTKWALEQGYISETDSPQEKEKVLNSINPKSIENDVDRDLNNVFSRMPTNSFKWVEAENSYAINKEELKKAIESALKDNSLSKTGRKHWLGVLADINKNSL